MPLQKFVNKKSALTFLYNSCERRKLPKSHYVNRITVYILPTKSAYIGTQISIKERDFNK